MTNNNGSTQTEAQNVEGIPFHLNKNTYFLSGTPKQTASGQFEYTINSMQELDATKTYTLNIDPGLLSDPEFALTLNDVGQVESINATLTDRVAPMITSLGTFITGIISAESAMTGVLDKSPKQIQSVLNECPDLKTRLEETLVENHQLPFNTFYYKDQDEKACLKKAMTALENFCSGSGINICSLKFIEDSEFITDSEELKKNRKFVTRKGFQQSLAKRETALRKDISGIVNAMPPNTIKRINEAIEAKVWLAFLDATINMDDDIWLARYVKNIQAELVNLEFEQIRTTKDKTLEINKKKNTIAAAIGGRSILARMNMLEGFLQQHRLNGKSASKQAIEGLVAARNELDALNSQYANLLQKVLSADKDTAPVEAAEDLSLPLVTRDYIDNTLKEENWITTNEGILASDYVMTLDPVSSDEASNDK